MIFRNRNKKNPVQEIIEAFIVTNELDGTAEKSINKISHGIQQSSSEYACLFSAMSNIELFMSDPLYYHILYIKYNKTKKELTVLLEESNLGIDLDKFEPLKHYTKVILDESKSPGDRIVEITLKNEKELIEILQILKPYIYVI